MEYDFMKRGYLLPEGCKDLIDVLRLKQKRAHYPLPKLPQLPAHLAKGCGKALKSWKLPAVQKEIVVPTQTSVMQLAALLGQKPFQIIADLMEQGIFANVKQLLGFDIIAKIARKYGFVARPAG